MNINAKPINNPPAALNNKLVLTIGPAWNKPVSIIVTKTNIPKPPKITKESYCDNQDNNPLSD